MRALLRVLNTPTESTYKRKWVDNHIGCSGVHKVVGIRDGERYHAKIYINKKQEHLGSFVELWDATCCRKSAEVRHANI